MENAQNKKIVKELITLIEKGNAHVSFEDAVYGLPTELRTLVPDNLPYSIWQLTEHIRITQKDILDFSTSKDFTSLVWPDEYWPPKIEDVTGEMWENTIKEIRRDKNTFFELLRANEDQLLTPFPWGKGQNLFREAMLIADHNAYHIGEIVVVRRMLKSWN